MAKKEGRIIHKVLVLFLIVALITSVLAVYEIFLFDGIESVFRYFIMGFILLYDLRLVYRTRKIIKGRTKKKPRKALFMFWLLIYSLVCFGVAYSLNYVYSKLSSVNKTDVTYTSYLVVMASNPTTDIKNAKDLKIGLLNDEKNPDGYIIPMEMIQKYKLQSSSSVQAALKGLDDKEIVINSTDNMWQIYDALFEQYIRKYIVNGETVIRR